MSAVQCPLTFHGIYSPRFGHNSSNASKTFLEVTTKESTKPARVGIVAFATKRRRQSRNLSSCTFIIFSPICGYCVLTQFTY